jgi:hypothetical protein
MNTKELIEKATKGTITKAETKKAYDALVEQAGDEYDLLLVLGRSEAKEYKDVVERYLQASHDPMLAKLSLQVLCRYWGLASEYEDELEKFISWVDWDEEEDVRLMAIGCVVDLYKKKENPKLLKYVYDVFKDDSEDEITRGAAYETLALVSGKSVNDLPQPIHFDIKSDVDKRVLAKVVELIGINCI